MFRPCYYVFCWRSWALYCTFKQNRVPWTNNISGKGKWHLLLLLLQCVCGAVEKTWPREYKQLKRCSVYLIADLQSLQTKSLGYINQATITNTFWCQCQSCVNTEPQSHCLSAHLQSFNVLFLYYGLGIPASGLGNKLGTGGGRGVSSTWKSRMADCSGAGSCGLYWRNGCRTSLLLLVLG